MTSYIKAKKSEADEKPSAPARPLPPPPRDFGIETPRSVHC
jgi:hypothetical protein